MFILVVLTLFASVCIRLTTTEQPTDSPTPVVDDTDINWGIPPCSPDDLSKDWKEITDARMLQNGNRRVFQYKESDWKIAFDKGEKGAPGYRGKDHWHRYNPFSKNDSDLYLDKQGHPTSRTKKPSHITTDCN